MLKRIKQLRAQKGISQQQLADVLGTSQQSINKYENHDIQPDISTLIRIANYFNTSVDYIIENTDIERLIEPIEKYDLNKGECKLIDDFRQLNSSEKESIEYIIKNYINNKK
ncbi:MAG: helix-turn-helix transcriptional regulator [Clostridia bacterium]|nr:helix-turn-helix transcriptional regulator [Clostridia bacterium]